jgi:hypothetical protein
VTDHLDALNDACRANPADIDAQIQLWRAVAALDEWVFINRGTAEAPRPYAIASDFGQLLCISSSAERAQATARANGFATGDESVPLFSIPLPAAIDWALSLGQHGISGVTIDYPQLGAWSPLPNLARLR